MILNQVGKFEYVRSIQIPDDDCCFWAYGDRVSSLKIKDKVYKSLHSWNNDLEWALESLDVWQSLGYKGAPSSPASFFHQEFKTCKLCYSMNQPFLDHFSGGIQQVFTAGKIKAPVYYYDIKNAYYWAGLQGLPLEFNLYQKGDKNYIVLARILNKVNIPDSFNREFVILDNNDVDFFGLDIDVIFGISFDSHENLIDDVMSDLQAKLPAKTFKAISQSYWGRWASVKPLVMVHQKNKNRKITVMKNRFRNSIWANIIVHRVIRNIWQYVNKKAVLLVVDAILTRDRLHDNNVPDEVGKIRLTNIYNKDIFIRAPGQWTTCPVSPNLGNWVKHSGVKRT